MLTGRDFICGTAAAALATPIKTLSQTTAPAFDAASRGVIQI